MKQVEFQVFRVADIRPNPFRDLERCPLQEGKVAALVESIRTTGFWDNIEARPGRDNKPEIAYGHHRVEALRRLRGEDAKIALTIKDLDDAMMLKKMAHENMQEWASCATAEHETVRGVVVAYADGRILLPHVWDKTAMKRVRFAPSFILGGDDPNVRLDHRRYTSTTIAAFLGWHEEKVRLVLQALELMELRILEPSMFEGLGPTQARILVQKVRKVAQESVCDVPESWKAENEPRGVEMDRVLLRNHVERKVAAWRAEQANTRGLDPLERLNRNAGSGTGVRIEGRRKKTKAEAARDRDSKSLLWYLQSPAERYAMAVAGFLKATEAVRQSAFTKKPAVKERRRVHKLLAQVRKVVDTLEVALGEVEKKSKTSGRR